MVTTHEKRRVRFFDDLVKGRTVAINFMFGSCTAVCPLSTDNLRKVQELIQRRLASTDDKDDPAQHTGMLTSVERATSCGSRYTKVRTPPTKEPYQRLSPRA